MKTPQNEPRDVERYVADTFESKKERHSSHKKEGKLLLSLDNYLTPKRSRSSGRLKGCWKSCWSCCRPWVSKKYFSAELVSCLGITIISYFFISSHTAIIVVSVKYLNQLKSIVSAFTCRVFSTTRTFI
jgi:hypothetical protein